MVTLTAVLEALPLHRRRSANRCRSTSDGQRQELAACAGRQAPEGTQRCGCRSSNELTEISGYHDQAI
jgi:hypothetical protein